MTQWIETYRGSVAPWECDVTEHFTVAYYCDRIEAAEANLASTLGIGEVLKAGGFARRYELRFARELRAGAAFHVVCAPIGTDGGLRLGHKVVDSVTGETVTFIDEHWDKAVAVDPARLAAWDGPASEARPQPRDRTGFTPTARGRIKPRDLDENGRVGIGGFVHKFTDSSIQTGAAVGLTADFIKTGRRGFSTFELALEVKHAPGVGAPYVVETGLLHLGSSSLRFLHVMTNPETGDEYARLGQYGVQLDLDKRRPAPLSDEFRERARKLLVPIG